MIFDTHAHYDDDKFDEDREELLNSMRRHRVGTIVNVGSTIESNAVVCQLVEKYQDVYGAIGVHPNEVGELNEEKFAWIGDLLDKDKILALGEIGLDYYYDEPDPAVQKIWFERQLELARQKEKPVIIHSRDAAKDTLDMMKTLHAGDIGGVIHCFSYSVEMAREYLNMGYFLGIGGVVTFPNAKKLKDVVAYMPIEQLVLETDCPYLSPVPNRGKRNSSMNLTYVIEEIANIKKMSVEEVECITEENAKRLYRM